MIKEAGNEFSGATAGRDDRCTWVVGLVNFGVYLGLLGL